MRNCFIYRIWSMSTMHNTYGIRWWLCLVILCYIGMELLVTAASNSVVAWAWETLEIYRHCVVFYQIYFLDSIKLYSIGLLAHFLFSVSQCNLVSSLCFSPSLTLYLSRSLYFSFSLSFSLSVSLSVFKCFLHFITLTRYNHTNGSLTEHDKFSDNFSLKSNFK